MEKFSRNYQIIFTFGEFINNEVKLDGTSMTVDYPITVDFAIGRSISYFTNTANVVIYGLDENRRKRLAKDAYNKRKYIRMEIKAGYGNNLCLIYRGAVTECYSFRQGGETEFRTIISSADAAIEMLADIRSESFSESTDVATKINSLGSKLIELKLGIVSPFIVFPDETDRGETFKGNALDMLSTLGNIEGAYGEENVMNIDMGKVNFLKQYEDIISNYGILQVNDSTGLLTTPVRRESLLSLKMLFEPAANVNQICHLDSKMLNLEGYFKVMSVSHDGTISGAKCGQLVTTLDLYLGLGVFNYL